MCKKSFLAFVLYVALARDYKNKGLITVIMCTLQEYVKVILSEKSSNIRKLNSMSRTVTRDIMHSVKNDLRKRTIIYGPYTWTLSIENSDLEEDEISEFGVSVTFHVERGQKIDISGYTSSKYIDYFDESFHLDIILPDKLLPKDKSELWAQIIEASRHELEHLSQPGLSSFASRKPETYYSKTADVDKRIVAYLLDPNEIPAFVRGFLRRVKSRDELISLIKRELAPKELSVDIESKVLNTWMKWADQNIRSYR